MKAALITLGLLLMLCIDDGATWGWRAPRLLREVCQPVCGTACVAATTCPHCSPVCSWACGKTICKWLKRKRSNSGDGGFLVKLPCKFEAWDTDNNGSISLSEFAFTGHASITDKNTEKVFAKLDTNGDMTLSKAELDSAPLLREKC